MNAPQHSKTAALAVILVMAAGCAMPRPYSRSDWQELGKVGLGRLANKAADIAVAQQQYRSYDSDYQVDQQGMLVGAVIETALTGTVAYFWQSKRNQVFTTVNVLTLVGAASDASELLKGMSR